MVVRRLLRSWVDRAYGWMFACGRKSADVVDNAGVSMGSCGHEGCTPGPFMVWPVQMLEVQRRFAPRFCPRRDCAQHSLGRGDRFQFQPFGSFRRADGRRVRRYRCLVCRRTFSKQTFAVSYYLKRPELLLPVAAGLQAGSAHRQLARTLGCAPSTVTRLSARLGRHAMLVLARSLRHLEGRLAEPIVLDHFETFEFTQ